ncbi:hypothetical protein IU459_01900 [Nocardia amamiensis]|uniref:Phage tail protein n=1 Tax=Nocardia amamiensis TaxID=404578 RepID=A0ABS0CN53_9NOCA|nr:hypothetical protein [Nocardia amamiensis]MBF6296294.1 hypothetical protein [Nocardia amamiensis]
MENQTNDAPVVFDDDVMITMRGVADSVGLPYTVNSLELVDREALAELREGSVGPIGPEGAAAWPWQWQGDVADVAALTGLGLTTADARKAWRVVSENAVYFWTGLEFIAFDNAFGKAGRRGPANQLTGAASAGAPGSAASAQITGIAPNQRLEITFPRGAAGDIGDPGAEGRIQDAADVALDAEHSLGEGFVLRWDAAAQKFRPAPNPRLGGAWVIGEKQFADVTNIAEASKVVAAITIPAQPMAWRPIVEGAVVQSSPSGTRCDAEVRIGHPDTGDLVGYGWGYAVSTLAYVTLNSVYEYPMQPGATAAVVPANQTVTLYVVVRRVVGAGTYTVRSNYSHLIVQAQPL